jgi:uncharacterized protein
MAKTVNYQDLLEAITPEIYVNLRRAIEIGRWPDGRELDQRQREDAMAAVIAYEQKTVPVNERTGYIDKGKKEGDHCDDDTQTLSFKE